MFEGINWFAVAVSSLAPILVGAVWYGKLFGNAWSEETGLTDADMKAKYNPVKFFGGTIALSFLATLFIRHFVAECQLTGAKAFAFGALDGAVIALTTVGVAFATNAIFEHKSLRYVLINVGFWVVGFALMGGILNVWK